MKKPFYLLLFLLIFTVFEVNAQLRGDVSKPVDYRGTIVNSQSATIQGKLASFFENNVTMNHSYSMSFSSVGGSYQNLNAYTNTMNVAFSDRIHGRFDVSFFHSPFGGNNLYGQGFDDPKVMLSNAELNFQLNDKTNISLQYHRTPYSPYGISPFGSRFNSFDRYNSRFY
ncbi:MAG: hypothetical protein ABJR05_02665 [Balneola sp.]